MNETSLLIRAVQSLVPEPCYTRIFTDYDFFDGECFKILLSKWLGYSIILGSVLEFVTNIDIGNILKVKLPQIMKISNAKSGDGINIWSVLFERIAISANSSYGFAKSFPFSAYGEGLFLGIQTSLVMFLVIYFSGNMLGAFLFLGIYGLTMSYLLSPLALLALLAGMQGVNILIVIMSKYCGMDCDLDCSSSSLGVANRSRVPDALMSAFLTRENYTAADGCLGYTGGTFGGWCGVNSNSWLQVDLGKEAVVFSATEQSYNSTYYTGSYYISYSTDGYNFTFAEEINNGTSSKMGKIKEPKALLKVDFLHYFQLFTGTSSKASYTSSFQIPERARFVRFHPVSFSSSHFPCMRVELQGCYVDASTPKTFAELYSGK